jgi:cytochrome b involved in lipid metabolism
MPFENEYLNEQPTQTNSKKTVSKFVVIIGALILLSGSYLAYSLYNNDLAIDTEIADVSESISIESNVDEINEPNAIVEEPPLQLNNNSEQIYTLEQVSENNNRDSCWTIIDKNVYDITSYVPNHPGGESEILQICGVDGTTLFNRPSAHRSGGARDILESFKIGTVSQ